jgi:tetratricopeptide (TPR) repeat protein
MTSRFCRLSGTFAMTVALATGTSGLLAQKPPAASGGRTWSCSTSSVVTACGDVANADLLRVANTIISFREAILDLFPADVTGTSGPTTIVVFHDRREFLPYLPPDENGKPDWAVGAYFASRPTRNYIAMALGTDRELSLEVVLHEYTHYLAQHTSLVFPTWLSEGLAEYYSTFAPAPDGSFLVGAPLPNRLGALQKAPLFPLKEMTSPESVSKIYRNQVQLGAFYAQAWAMVHYLTVGHNGTRPGQMDAYLKGLRTGQLDSAAFERAFGPLPVLERELFYYVRRSSFPAVRYWRTTVGPAKRVLPSISDPVAMTPAAALRLQADLLVSMQWVDEGTKRIEQSLALEPESSAARITLGRAQMAAEHWSEAERTLSGVASSRPDDFEALYELSIALRQQKKYEQAYAALTEATALNPSSEAAWMEQSLNASALRRDAEADAAFAKARNLSSRITLLSGRSVEALSIDRPELAITSAQQYLDRAGPDEDTAYVAFFGVIGAWRTHRAEDARKLVEAARTSVRPGAWPATIAEFMSGSMTADALVSKAKSDGQRTEAHAYAGMKAEADGDRASALLHLQWVKTRGRRNYIEYRLATETLGRLEAERAERPGRASVDTSH